MRNSNTNLPELRKVALMRRKVELAKRTTKIVFLVALFVSCFSLSVYIGFTVPFLLFR